MNNTPHSGDWLDEIFYKAVGLKELDKGVHAGIKVTAMKIDGWPEAKAQILSKHKLEVLEGRIDEIKKVPFDIDTPNISWLYFKNRQTELENERAKIKGVTNG